MAATQRTLIRYWGSYFKSADQVERVASYFTAALDAGWRCHLVCGQPPQDPAWLEPLSAGPVQCHYVPRARGNFDRRCVARVRHLCRELRPDVLHCDNMHTSPLLGAWLAGVPGRVWTKHAMQPAREAMRDPTLRDRLAPAVRLSAALASAVLPISRLMAEELIALGVPAAKIHVLPLPVMPSRPAARRPARAGLGFSDEDFVIGTVGHAVPVKGWDVLVDAFIALATDEPRARLLLVGSVSSAAEQALHARLHERLGASGLDAAVTWTGHRTDVSAMLAAMDCFVLPSRSEGFSLALVEALQAGLPVIATPVGIVPDVIEAEQSGLVVPCGDVTALTHALASLCRNTALRDRLASNAAQAVDSIPGPEEHAQALLTIYNSLIS